MVVSYRSNPPDLFRADWKWALKETLSHIWFGTFYRSLEDYWNIWNDRPAYISKYFGVEPTDERAAHD